MISDYRKRLLRNGSYMGEVLKNQSDLIMNQTFTNDIAYRKCYIDGKPVDAKYITYSQSPRILLKFILYTDTELTEIYTY